jgi:hypothetical protein
MHKKYFPDKRAAIKGGNCLVLITVDIEHRIQMTCKTIIIPSHSQVSKKWSKGVQLGLKACTSTDGPQFLLVQYVFAATQAHRQE